VIGDSAIGHFRVMRVKMDNTLEDLSAMASATASFTEGKIEPPTLIRATMHFDGNEFAH